jgi:signal transduction histidine kinase
MRLSVEPCEVTALVADAVESVRPAAGAKGIALATTLASDRVGILCAPDRLRQVVWNLAMNAIKFTPAGGHVEVAVTCTDHSADIVVADNGVGIGPDVLPHVFEPFRQEDSSSTRAHGGLGLGLAPVKHLVELHGGQVTAAATALEGLMLVRDGRPDVVLSDIAMVGYDGYWLVNEIRRLGEGDISRIPVVATTAYGEHSRARTLAAGFTELLPKPVDPETLCLTIGKVTGR